MCWSSMHSIAHNDCIGFDCSVSMYYNVLGVEVGLTNTTTQDTLETCAHTILTTLTLIAINGSQSIQLKVSLIAGRVDANAFRDCVWYKTREKTMK